MRLFLQMILSLGVLAPLSVCASQRSMSLQPERVIVFRDDEVPVFKVIEEQGKKRVVIDERHLQGPVKKR